MEKLLPLLHDNFIPEVYAEYLIPYAAVAISILAVLLLYPLLSRLGRFSLPVSSILGLGLFAGLEWFIERKTIYSSMAFSALRWRLLNSTGFTDASHAFYKLFDPTYRMHYLLFSFLLILLVTGVLYNYKARRSIFYLQTLSTALFAVSCAAVSFLSFSKGKVIILVPYSTLITGIFLLLAGLSFGIYLAGFLSGRNALVSVFLPAAGALLLTAATFKGEYKMLDGVLYRFGYAKLFQVLPYTEVTMADFLIIPASGLFTALLVYAARRCKAKAEY